MKKIILIILIFLLFCGCFEYKKNFENTNNNPSNTGNKDNKHLNNINLSISNNKSINYIKNISYEVIEFGQWGEKEEGYYFYSKDNKTIIVINAGFKPFGGYKIKIINITLENNTLLIYYKVIPPKNFSIAVITYPYIKIAVNGTFKDVKVYESK